MEGKRKRGVGLNQVWPTKGSEMRNDLTLQTDTQKALLRRPGSQDGKLRWGRGSRKTSGRGKRAGDRLGAVGRLFLAVPPPNGYLGNIGRTKQ